MLPNHFKDPFYVFNYFVIPKTQYYESVATQTVISFSIVLLIFKMLATINLYYQFGRK